MVVIYMIYYFNCDQLAKIVVLSISVVQLFFLLFFNLSSVKVSEIVHPVKILASHVWDLFLALRTHCSCTEPIPESCLLISTWVFWHMQLILYHWEIVFSLLCGELWTHSQTFYMRNICHFYYELYFICGIIYLFVWTHW